MKLFILLIIACAATDPCDRDHAPEVYRGEPVPLAQCQGVAPHVLSAMPDLPDGFYYGGACVRDDLLLGKRT